MHMHKYCQCTRGTSCYVHWHVYFPNSNKICLTGYTQSLVILEGMPYMDSRKFGNITFHVQCTCTRTSTSVLHLHLILKFLTPLRAGTTAKTWPLFDRTAILSAHAQLMHNVYYYRVCTTHMMLIVRYTGRCWSKLLWNTSILLFMPSHTSHCLVVQVCLFVILPEARTKLWIYSRVGGGHYTQCT
jgi:hypothetical protein